MSVDSSMKTVLSMLALLIAGCHNQEIHLAPETVQLRAALKDIDRIEVGYANIERPSEPTFEVINEERIPATLWEDASFAVVDPSEVAAVIESLDFIPNGDKRWGCGCTGSEIIKFYRNDTVIINLRLHHGKSITWYEGTWSNCHTKMTDTSADSLTQWLEGHGMPHPRKNWLSGSRQDGFPPARE